MAQLSNYLIANRKRLSLSQAEMAFLLGAQGGGQISRYERFVREPSLETALAFEMIFQRSASELFDGLYQRVEREVAARAKVLADRQKPDPKGVRKRELLINIANKSIN